MKKYQLLRLISHLQNDAEIGFQPGDLGPDQPAESITNGIETEAGSIAKCEQGIDFILRN